MFHINKPTEHTIHRFFTSINPQNTLHTDCFTSINPQNTLDRDCFTSINPQNTLYTHYFTSINSQNLCSEYGHTHVTFPGLPKPVVNIKSNSELTKNGLVLNTRAQF